LVSGAVRGPRTLFATHFHELTALAGRHERVVNYTVAVAEIGAETGAAAGLEGEAGADAAADVLVGPQAERPAEGGIEFLYRIVPGGADRSYGLHVARMAGLPRPLLARAEQILAQLEGDAGPGAETVIQAELFAAPVPAEPTALTHELAAVDVDNLTPLEALGALHTLRERARRELHDLATPRSAAAPVEGDEEGIGGRDG
jgi:DNA mismatch repair protein MutS